MNFAVPPHPVATLAIIDSDAVFPVRRIFCIGRNYAEHTREMGNSPEKTPPCFFTKPSDAIVASGSTIDYPLATNNLHYEAELVVALASGGTHITAADALSHVFGYAVGIDLTRRDLQKNSKETGTPWDTGKAFDNSAPCSPIQLIAAVPEPHQADIWLTVNGESRQSSNTAKLIWSIEEMIVALSELFELRAGDLIFTGTPEGVGPVVSGDQILAGVDGVGTVEVKIR